MNDKPQSIKAFLAFGIFLLSLALAACSGAPQSNSGIGQQGASAPAGGITKLDSCALLTKADAEQLLGEPVGEPSRNDAGDEVTGDERAVSQCVYSTTGDSFKSVSVLVRRDVAGSNATDGLDQIRSSAEATTAFTPINGLGDAALWREDELGHQLNVAQGRYLLITSARLDKGAPTLELSKSVAQRVLSRLP